jgi:hypothetical protein
MTSNPRRSGLRDDGCAAPAAVANGPRPRSPFHPRARSPSPRRLRPPIRRRSRRLRSPRSTGRPLWRRMLRMRAPRMEPPMGLRLARCAKPHPFRQVPSWFRQVLSWRSRLNRSPRPDRRTSRASRPATSLRPRVGTASGKGASACRGFVCRRCPPLSSRCNSRRSAPSSAGAATLFARCRRPLRCSAPSGFPSICAASSSPTCAPRGTTMPA